MYINIQLFAKRGNGGAASNTYQSKFGLPNVGTRVALVTPGGMGTQGTEIPSIDDVQAYFETGAFDNYGTNAGAKKQIIKQIANDMNSRGFEASISEDGLKILPNGETGHAISIGRSNDRWRARSSTSAGIRERGGMRGALGRASRKR